MAQGKNAKKRAARRAFLNDPDPVQSMPYSFKVVEYRDGTRRVLTFASLTSYKEHLENLYTPKEAARLLLLHGHDESVKETGKAFRASVINRGADHSKAKPKPLLKGVTTLPSVTGGRFRKEGFATTPHDVTQSQERDRERKALIEAEQVRESQTPKLQAVRQKYRAI